MTANIPDELLALVPAELRNRACLCAACVADFNRQQSSARARTPVIFSRSSFEGGAGRGEEAPTLSVQFPSPQPSPRLGGERETEAVSSCAALPGEFYFDAGRMVFTASYHLRRGCCCGSGCRHCPYEPAK